MHVFGYSARVMGCKSFYNPYNRLGMAEKTKQLKKQLYTLAEVRVGDTVKITQKIKEGVKEMNQLFEGLVIAKQHGDGVLGNITIRKVSAGIGVEKILPIHLPTITKVDILKRSHVRRAKLYYIRDKASREVRKKMKKIWTEKFAEISEISEPETVTTIVKKEEN